MTRKVWRCRWGSCLSAPRTFTKSFRYSWLVLAEAPDIRRASRALIALDIGKATAFMFFEQFLDLLVSCICYPWYPLVLNPSIVSTGMRLPCDDINRLSEWGQPEMLPRLYYCVSIVPAQGCRTHRDRWMDSEHAGHIQECVVAWYACAFLPGPGYIVRPLSMALIVLFSFPFSVVLIIIISI